MTSSRLEKSLVGSSPSVHYSFPAAAVPDTNILTVNEKSNDCLANWDFAIEIIGLFFSSSTTVYRECISEPFFVCFYDLKECLDPATATSDLTTGYWSLVDSKGKICNFRLWINCFDFQEPADIMSGKFGLVNYSSRKHISISVPSSTEVMSPHIKSVEELRVLGINLSSFNTPTQFFICVAGVFLFYLIYGYLQVTVNQWSLICAFVYLCHCWLFWVSVLSGADILSGGI